ncbi:inverse autotransporter beta domain-containing protein [Pseudomonas sp. RT6P73]
MLFSKKAITYWTLLCFTGNVTSSGATPFPQAIAVERQQQYLIYPPNQGETLESVAERFSLPVSSLSALREQFQAYGWLSTSVLVPYSSEGEARLYNNYLIYQLKEGESLAAVAGRFNRSARELSTLNGQVMLASKLTTLKAGDFILVPGPIGSFDNRASAQNRKEQEKLVSGVAQEVVGAAQILGANQRRGADPSGILTQRAAGGLTGGASRELENFLGANGTAKVGIQANVNNGQFNYSLDYLQPIYEREDDIFFGQIGTRTFGERNLANLGLGYRNQVDEHWVLGVNSFIDQDMSRNHTRGGIGAEAWTDQARFSANYYTPLSGWKNSKDHRLNSDPDTRILQERAARGWDANVEASVPGVRQLSVSGKYFQWGGDRVDVSGSRSQTEKDPRGYTLGTKYQPIPLLNLNAQHTKVTGGRAGWDLGVGLTWDFDKSLQQMLDPQKSIALRPLAQAKTDIVNRNYNIVLEYQEKDKFAPLAFALTSMSMMAGTNDPGLRVQGGRQGNITYSSSDPATLSVDSVSGLLSAIMIGTVTITALEQTGAGKVSGSASYTVTVTPNTSVAPSISGLRIVGQASRGMPVMEVGQTLSATYAFNANTGHPDDESLYLWGHQATTESNVGSGQKVKDRGQVPGYTIGELDLGKVLEVSVQPKNGLGVLGVTQTLAAESAVINSSQKPQISALTITGTLELGQKLTASYTYVDPNGGADHSTYAWGLQSTTAAAVDNSTQVVPGDGTVKSPALDSTYLGAVVELSVLAKNNLSVPLTGNKLTADTSGLDTGGTGGTVIDSSQKPQISALTITGTLDLGQTLEASYTYVDPNGGADHSTYAWGLQSTTAAAVDNSTQVVPGNGTVKSPALDSTYLGAVVELSVLAKNNLSVPLTGNKLTADTSGLDTGGTGGTVIDSSQKPQISALTITGTLDLGQTLEASYTYVDPNGGADHSTYAWGLQSTTAAAVDNSTQVVPGNGTVKSPALDSTYLGAVVELSVLAKNNLSVPLTGNKLTADTSGLDTGGTGGTVIDSSQKPQISALTITGTLDLGQTLEASYTYVDPNGGADHSTYAWGLQSTTAAAVDNSTQVVPGNGTVKSPALDSTYLGAVVELSVLAKNNLSVPLTGNKLTADTSGLDTGGTGGTVIDSSQKPQISALTITGTLDLGQTLEASYTYVDPNGGADHSTYAWGLQSTTAAAVDNSTQVVPGNGTVKSPALDSTYLGAVVELSVLAKNNLSVPLTGNKLTADTSGLDTGGTGGTVIDSSQKPQISALTITGTLDLGQTLEASYTYVDPNGGADHSTYAWGLQSTTAAAVDNSTQVVPGDGTVKSPALDSTYLGAVVELSVLAKNNLSVPLTGNKLTADTSGLDTGGTGGTVIDSSQKPQISALTITGTLDLGQTLEASYTYVDPNGGADHSTYAWGLQSTTAAAVDNSTQVVPGNGTVKSPALDSTYLGAVVELSVLAKNNLSVPLTGNKLTADTSGLDTGGTGGTVIDSSQKPQISALTITGTLDLGQTLEASYTYVDPNGGADHSTYAWGLQSTTAAAVDNSTQVVPGDGTVKSPALDSTYLGAVVELSVLAKNNLSVPLTGNKLTADTSGLDTGGTGGTVIDSSQKPQISALTITGTLDLGQTLEASYTYVDPNGGADHSTYAWGLQSTTAAAVDNSTQVVPGNGTVKSPALDSTYLGAVVELSVLAKNNLSVPLTGNKLTADTSGLDTGGTGGTVIDSSQKPQISALTITGTLDLGQTLEASYTYVDPNGGADHSTYAWGLQSTTAAAVDNSTQVVPGDGTVKSPALDSTYLGAVVELSVLAKNNLSVPLTGNKLTADTSGLDTGGTGGTVIDSSQKPQISALTITGTLDLGQTLEASYTYVDPNGGADHSTYAWGLQSTTAAAVDNSTQVVPGNGTVKSPALDSTYLGAVVELSVLAKNNLSVPLTGNKLTADTSGLDTGGTGGTVIDSKQKPKIDNLQISGTLDLGQILTATYTYTDPNGGLDRSTYAWGRQDTATAVDSSTQVVPDNGTVTSPALDAQTYYGNLVELTILPTNNLKVPLTGDKVTATHEIAPGVTDVEIIDFDSGAAVGKVGQKLKATFNYVGNSDGAVNFQWYRNGGAIAGATNQIYQLIYMDQGADITVGVTPISQSGVAGLEKISDRLQSIASGIEPFIQPEVTALNWHDASNFCSSQNARLPKVDDLKELFTRLTGDVEASEENAPGNGIMRDIYGWPFENGEAKNYYWAEEAVPGTGTWDEHYAVEMNNGHVSKNVAGTLMQVACIK